MIFSAARPAEYLSRPSLRRRVRFFSLPSIAAPSTIGTASTQNNSSPTFSSRSTDWPLTRSASSVSTSWLMRYSGCSRARRMPTVPEGQLSSS
jgi:hypothetical protein